MLCCAANMTCINSSDDMWCNLNGTLSRLCASKFWDSDLTWNSANPDFTPCFERTFLVWIPCAFLWLLSPIAIYRLRTTNAFNIPLNLYNTFKLSIIAAIGAVSLYDIVHYVCSSSYDGLNDVDFYSPVVKFLTFCFLFILTYAGVHRGIRTSPTLFMFSLLLVVCGAPQFRTEINSASETNTYSGSISYLVYYPLAVVVFLLNCFVDARSEIRNFPYRKNVSPENNVSFLSWIFFYWLDGFMWRGYKHTLQDDEVYDLDYDMDPEEIIKEFEPEWQLTLDRVRRRTGKQIDEIPQEASIIGPMWRTYGLTFCGGHILKVLHSLSLFASPLVLKWLIAFVGDENEFAWHGYVYVTLLFLITGFQTLVMAGQQNIMYRIAIQIRTALVQLIYKKSLRISNGTKKDFPLGQVVNLMSVDAQRFIDLMVYIPLIVVIPLDIFLCLYLLWGILGPSVVAGLVVLILLVPLNMVIASHIQNLQIRQMTRKDNRVKLMNEILAGIKVLKFYAWEPSFEREVFSIRDGEMNLLRRSAYLYAGTSFIFTCAPFLVSLVTFAVFVFSSEENVLDAQVAFVSLSLFNILKLPLFFLPSLISSIVQAHVAIKRINKFLNSEELDPNAVSHDCRPTEPIVVEHGQFSWDGDKGALSLKDINLTIRSGSLVAVVGSVGSGKSSLLSALLGEMYKQSGYVNTYGNIAYVPQQAWIRNTTMKDNITYGAASNESFYHEVVEACAMRPDFRMMPAGDQTEIGEKGVNLSGGQKQRVSLARAVFSNSDVYLLDDPLSAVDSHVGKHIFERVVGPNGLLKEKTRVLVTHGISFLPQMDTIIVMQDGQISESGTYSELVERGGAFAHFLAAYQSAENANMESEKNMGKISMDEVAEVENSIGFPQSSLRRFSKSVVEKEVDDENAKLIEVETMELGSVKWSVMKYYLRAAGYFMVFLTIFTNTSYQVFDIFANIWLSWWSSDTTIVQNGHQDMSKQYMYVGVYGACGTIQAISIVTRVIMMYFGMLTAANFIHTGVLKSVMRWPVTTFDTIPTGRIINRFAFDVDALDNTLPNNVGQLLNTTTTILSAIFMICYSTPTFIYLLLPFVIIYFCVQRFFAVTSRQLKRLDAVSKSPLYSHFGESFSGAACIRASGLESKFIQTAENKVAANLKCFHSYSISSRWLAVRLELIGTAVVFFSALLIVLGRSTLEASLAGLSVSYSLQITETLYFWARVFTESETSLVSIERLKEYSEVEQEAPLTLPNEAVPKSWPSNGEIRFDNFQVRYRANLELVLKGISFRVNGGEKVGIVGRTGAGKSSLSLCLFRLLEAAGGRIIIDGIDISTLGLHTLRTNLTIIPQDPVLFTGKLRMNLDPGNVYLDDMVWRALEMANLRTTVSNLSSGLQHEITEGGGNFSVGQRQLICLARAVLRKTKILILDEATAAVDLETDDLIQKIVKREFSECTLLTIAHRLNTVMDYDRIMVMDKGMVVEFDAPEVLLKSKQSVFYKMAVDAGLVKDGAAPV